MLFFTRILIGVVFVTFILTPPSARAQLDDPGTLSGIFEEIFGTVPKVAIDAQIESIPVTIETNSELELSGQKLIVTAYAPAATSGSFAKPDTLGQTQILLTGLTSPLNITVAAPANLIETLEFARLDANIIDTNGNPVWVTKAEGFYRDGETVVLGLVPLIDFNNEPDAVAQSAISLETIEGKAVLSQKSKIFPGSTLNIQLIESGLAGGQSILIAAETVINLDQKDAPFAFKLDRAIYSEDDDRSYGLNAWITDWAGRKTHVMEQPVPYNGPDHDYKLSLDKYTLESATYTGQPAAQAQTRIQGIASFDAYKGLPSGSRLIATLNRAVGGFGTSRTLTRQTFLLDGLAGNVNFDLAASSTNFDPLIPAPTLDIKVTDSSGRVFFSAQGRRVQEGMNVIQLSQTANY